MNFRILVFCLLETLVCWGTFGANSDIKLKQKTNEQNVTVRTRRRRYVVFPEGSTITIAACLTEAALTGGDSIFTTGVAWAMSYDLPNETLPQKSSRREFPSLVLQRRKRDLFSRVEKLIDSTGFDGRSCVLKTICETAQRIIPRQGILEEIFRLVFTYPSEGNGNLNWHSSRHKTYSKAHEAGISYENCDETFPCPISLLQLGLDFGKY